MFFFFFGGVVGKFFEYFERYEKFSDMPHINIF